MVGGCFSRVCDVLDFVVVEKVLELKVSAAEQKDLGQASPEFV